MTQCHRHAPHCRPHSSHHLDIYTAPQVMTRRVVEPNRKYIDVQRIYNRKHVLKVGACNQ